jgi:hypothetical protein
MRRVTEMRRATCLLLALLAGCPEPSAPSATTTTTTVTPLPTTTAPPPSSPQPAAPPVAEPWLQASLSTSAIDGTLPRGWPLLVDARLLHPRALEPGAPALTLDGPGGAWTAAARVEVTDVSGARVEWPLRPVASLEGSLTLEPDEEAVLGWTLAPGDSSALTAGTYALSLVVESGGRRAESAPARLVVTAPLATPTPAQREELAILTASLAALQGDVDAAVEASATLAGPDASARALGVRADLLLLAGKPREAARAYDEAIAAFHRASPAAREPPRWLLRGLAEARAAMPPPEEPPPEGE